MKKKMMMMMKNQLRNHKGHLDRVDIHCPGTNISVDAFCLEYQASLLNQPGITKPSLPEDSDSLIAHPVTHSLPLAIAAPQLNRDRRGQSFDIHPSCPDRLSWAELNQPQSIQEKHAPQRMPGESRELHGNRLVRAPIYSLRRSSFPPSFRL